MQTLVSSDKNKDQEINIYHFLSFDEIYKRFKDNHNSSKEMHCVIKKRDPSKTNGVLPYLDAVKAALCFGWIDSRLKNINGELVQRFSPRSKHSHWTELNISRCIELDKQGLLDESGKTMCPYFSK